jgi:flagellum-specific peptidoglycan hydrolase FlgJ
MKRKMIAILILTLFSNCLTAPPINEVVIIASTEIGRQNILNELKKHNIRHPDIVFAQIQLETGNNTSRFCKQNNNLFGMKLAKNRKTTAIGVDNSMSIYRTWQESIEDYSIWQKKYYHGGDYFQFLKGRYAEDKQYIRKLKKLI